jgi:hypothetical protein
VIKETIPQTIDMSLNRGLFIRILLDISGEESNNSDVIRRIIVVTASQRLMSENVSEKFIFSQLDDFEIYGYGLHIRGGLKFLY